jgi:hypothetical protein
MSFYSPFSHSTPIMLSTSNFLLLHVKYSTWLRKLYFQFRDVGWEGGDGISQFCSLRGIQWLGWRGIIKNVNNPKYSVQLKLNLMSYKKQHLVLCSSCWKLQFSMFRRTNSLTLESLLFELVAVSSNSCMSFQYAMKFLKYWLDSNVTYECCWKLYSSTFMSENE